MLEYDDVMNKQRVAVYGLREELLAGIDQKGLILEDYVASMVADALDRFAPRNVHADQWDTDALKKFMVEQFGLDLAKNGIDADRLNRQELGDSIFEKLKRSVRRQRKTDWRGRHALSRAHDHAQRAGHAVERPSAQHGPLERRH